MVLPGAALAQAPVPDLSVQPHRSDLLVGEPVIVELALRNDASVPVDTFYDKTWKWDAASKEVQLRQGGEIVQSLPFAEAGVALEGAPGSRLAPGQTVLAYRIYLPVIRDRAADAWIFPEPGDYQLVARYWEPDGQEIVSAPASITIRAPEQASEATLEWQPDYYLFFGGFEVSDPDYVTPGIRELARSFQQYPHEFPDSPFAPYARFINLRAAVLTDPEPRHTGTQTRRLGLMQALGSYTDSANLPSPYFTGQALIWRAGLQKETGKSEDLLRTAERLQKEFPELPGVAELVEDTARLRRADPEDR